MADALVWAVSGSHRQPLGSDLRVHPGRMRTNTGEGADDSRPLAGNESGYPTPGRGFLGSPAAARRRS